MILVLNAGSSSIKVEVFDDSLTPLIAGSATGIGSGGELELGDRSETLTLPDHSTALAAILDGLAGHGITPGALRAAGHRIVHGGPDLTAPALLTPDIIAAIEACIPLAPLHNPHNLAAVQALAAIAPDLPQTASFDTAFHATNPEVAVTYALPAAERAKGIRRYGFHGLSYASMVHHFGTDLPPRLLAFHLGNGASLCAIREGQSVASSMGYSPLDGLTMGTRTGAIDGMAVLRLVQDHGLDQASQILNKESGLKGLAGENDMRDLLARDDAEAKLAVDHFCYWAARHGGSAITAMGGIDAIAFTGGIGENAETIRDRIISHLTYLVQLPVHVVPAEEERQIARDALTVLSN